MAKRKQSLTNSVPPVAKPAPILQMYNPTSAIRFSYVVILSLSISSTLYSFVSRITAGDLSTVSRSLDDWWEIGGLIVWKTVELAIGWWGGYDRVDVASLTVLSHVPHLYLLTSFYGIRPTTMLSCLIIDSLSTYIPFAVLRGTAASHQTPAPPGKVSNQSLVNDISLRLTTSLLAAAIYGVIVFGSFSSWIPVYLATHFEGIRDLSSAHGAALPWLITSFIPIGFAAQEFVFRPAVGATRNGYDDEIASFNPETSSLFDTLKYNFWGYSPRTRTLIKRTFVLVALSGLHTWVQTYVAIEGVEGYGAAGWSGVWASAATITSVAFWWVGDVEGVSN